MLANVLLALAVVGAGVVAEWRDLAPLYQDLHAHPELAFHETATAGKLAGRLRTLGFDVTTGVGKTGSSGS